MVGGVAGGRAGDKLSASVLQDAGRNVITFLPASCKTEALNLSPALPPATPPTIACSAPLRSAGPHYLLLLPVYKPKEPTIYMFTNSQRQEERTGKYGTPRVQYLQELVAQFQNASTEESKEKIVANLANFAYDPYNYTFLRQLNVLELFLDCITEPNEKLIEFGAGGICNSCVDPANAAVIIKCDGIPLLIQCLSSPVKNTVNYGLGALYYLCNATTKGDILRPEVVDIIKRYAAAAGFTNLAQAFLDKHAPENH